ncbi:hypothetical protein [Methylobacterium sp. J-068]|uniref:hypothetical protein n=1 Tax=Methylobacterium sp. J-068 TaxID=2836649 RepID=UPI001FB9DB3A|nr:hypothetical protein [Methylobacterium sp. J-068]MCJ2033876.1 hypothetical protein [Methylobacterium sp. J-068]
MTFRTALLSASILGGLVLGLPEPASAAQGAHAHQRVAKAYRYSCQPPLKFAAGACVRRCPAGYRDAGRYCRFRNMSR